MDWRSGKPNTTGGSAFRGISTRGGRGRGRARGAPPTGRGGSTSTPTTTPGPSQPASLPPTPSAIQDPAPSANLPPRPKPPSRRASHQHPRRAPSLTHLDIPKATESATDPPTTPGGRPQVPRRASHNPPSASQNQASHPIPSVKLDPSSPTTPASPRPKPSRKRSHNRTRSSSKASTQGQLSAAPSVTSLKDKAKETPPHLAMASAPPDVQSFGLRTNIDTLVERVRAMAMAGSSPDRDRDGLYTPSEGHIDWAGDEDDTLPDLDDWVRPKSAEPKEVEKTESDQTSEKPVLSPVEEVASPGLPVLDKTQEKSKEKAVGAKHKEKNQRAEDAKEVKELKATNEVNSNREKESGSGRSKTRGKNRSKGSVSENVLADAGASSSGVNKTPTEVAPSTILKARQPLVHPLPPKPQVIPTPLRGPKPRAPPPVLPPADMTATNAHDRPSAPLPEVRPAQPLTPEHVGPITKTGGDLDCPRPASPESEAKQRAFDPSVDWSKAPWPSESPATPEPAIPKVDEASTTHSEPRGKKRAFDPSVDWAKAPYPSKIPSPTRRSPIRPSSSRSGHFSPPLPHHPHTAPPHGIPHSSSHNTPPRIFPARTQPPAHTRSQVNSPDTSPRRLRIREGPTHSRAHSSPQTGPGTRTHASRPVITLDAISRISRTLGVPGTVTPPRGQAVEVAVTD